MPLRRRLFVVICVIIVSTTAVCAKAEEPLARARMATPTSFIEAAVNMLSFFEAATGNQQKAACIQNLYFGTPYALRAVVNIMWKYPDYPAEATLIVLSNNLCAAGKEPPESRPELWRYADASSIQVPEASTTSVVVEASISILLKKAVTERQTEAARCIGEKQGSSEWMNQIAARLQPSARISAAEAVFDAVNAACGYPGGNVAIRAVTLPMFLDIDRAVSERLLAVRDLQSCDRQVDEAARTECVSLRASLRRNEIATKAALAGNAAERQRVENSLDAMRRAAWRLPDGRLIFQDSNRDWRFEDGSPVPPDLAARRVPPPR